MASAATERTLLLSSAPKPPHSPKPQRTVTFNPQTTVSNPNGPSEISTLHSASPPTTSALQQVAAPTQPKLSTLNSKLRRRNSHGSPLATQPLPVPASKIGPQRTTKTAQKLKLLPNPDPSEEGSDEESGRDVYSQFTRIKDPTARRDAAALGKADRERLPRVTAYCTANEYRLEGLMKYFKSKKARHKGANPKQFDECIYTPYNYDRRRNSGDLEEEDATFDGPSTPHQRERRFSDSAIEVEGNTSQRREDLIDFTTSPGDEPTDLDSSIQTQHVSSHTAHSTPDFDTTVHTPEVFLFQYGTVVIWGMTPAQETALLSEISKFESEKLSATDIQTENFNFYYTREYQARIYNDFISLREKKNYMAKLAISHALAQSVKTSLFEDLLSTTIATTQHLPEQIALTGRIALSRREIHQQIGQLFILRINIHLQGSVLDSPELMWAEPSLEPVYAAVRSYLEMDQRAGLLTERLSVIGDLLAVLKDQVGTKHGEYLEWIAAVNIVVDLYAGVE
ncbi:uncharacterized protein KY384_003085 [Bacidia gigantensis]|uniref:uncharacterized protein n=1 Tax=Bacidia gigantensis TaxID=2732470 RepID=UPI001D055DD5|nr:uncharacterized protein KY384_003085 [Bacidia gigantensis]KAG8531456.1 hypothetical protein KY384_003085 [Bacidia gigantensis]